MPFGPDELERRREQREALRQKRLIQHKRMIIRLIVAGVLLLLAAVVVVFVVLSGRDKPKKTDSKATTAAPTTVSRVETPKSSKTVIHFAAAGDLNITDKVIASGGTGLNYTALLADVLPLLADADLTALNFEGNVVGPPYGTATVSAPTQLLEALRAAGVDMVQVANSCTIKNGVTGMTATLDAFRAEGIEPLGAYATNEEYADNGGYTMWEVQGVRVAVVAFTKGMDNYALPDHSQDCVNLLYNDYSSKYVDVDEKGITEILDKVNKEEPDITVVMLHWGSEYNDTHSASQETIRKLLLENGVDVIIGTHPHYVQEIDFDKKAGTLVAYSLGDFVGDGIKSGTEYSIILDLEITKDNTTGQTKVTGYSYTPIFSYEDEDGKLRILRIEPAVRAYEGGYINRISQEVYDAMKYALERIEDRVTPD